MTSPKRTKYECQSWLIVKTDVVGGRGGGNCTVGKEKKVTVKDDNDDDVEIEAQNDDDEIEEPKLTKVR